MQTLIISLITRLYFGTQSCAALPFASFLLTPRWQLRTAPPCAHDTPRLAGLLLQRPTTPALGWSDGGSDAHPLRHPAAWFCLLGSAAHEICLRSLEITKSRNDGG